MLALGLTILDTNNYYYLLVQSKMYIFASCKVSLIHISCNLINFVQIITQSKHNKQLIIHLLTWKCAFCLTISKRFTRCNLFCNTLDKWADSTRQPKTNHVHLMFSQKKGIAPVSCPITFYSISFKNRNHTFLFLFPRFPNSTNIWYTH